MTTHPAPRLIHRDGDRSFSDTISVCPNHDIAIQVGPLSIARPLKEWHELGHRQMDFDRMPKWKKFIITLLLK